MLLKDEKRGPNTDPGTLGFDLSFIREIMTPNGGPFVLLPTGRLLSRKLLEYPDEEFNLTPVKSIWMIKIEARVGCSFPSRAAHRQQGRGVQWELNQNAWKLTNIIEWK